MINNCGARTKSLLHTPVPRYSHQAKQPIKISEWTLRLRPEIVRL